MTTTETEFEARLHDALAEPMSDYQAAALDRRVRPAIAASAFPIAGSRPRFRRSVLLAAALFVLVPSVIGVGAAILSTESPFGLSSAQEFEAERDAAMAVVPLPAGRTWPDHLRTLPSGDFSRGGGRSDVESTATCIWFDEWLDARAIGAASREAAAATTIASIPTWPSWDSLFWDDSYTAYLADLIAAVDAGDEAAVEAALALNCSWLADG